MNAGEIFYAVAGERGFLKLTGVIRHPLSQRLSQAARRVLDGAGVRNVVVDLQEALFIDSTCLGLLACVATRCLELGLTRPIIVSTQKDVTGLLKTMGFDRAFVLVDSSGPFGAVLADAADLAGLTARPDPRIILDAHRALSEMNEKNRHLFQSVIEILDADVNADDWVPPSGQRSAASVPPRRQAL
jgi:anti-anti-sigma factor